jgi:hypothetical protein
MKTNTMLIIAGAVLVYFLWVKPKAKVEVGAVPQERINEGFAVANSIYGSVSQLWA